MLVALYKSLSRENPFLISDLIDNNCVLSNDEFISKEVSGFYSYYNYTKELYVKINKLENNTAEDDSNVVYEDTPNDDKEVVNENVLDSASKDVSDNPDTSAVYYYIIVALFCISLIILLLYIKKDYK